jgi:ParB-like chromosome segregation protein Spo0J
MSKAEKKPRAQSRNSLKKDDDPMAIEVALWPIERLAPYDRNPRVISEHAIDRVAASIKAFGFNVPIVVNPAGEIAAGHTRLKAALKLDLKRVPVIVRDMSEEDLRAYRIADNKTAEFSGWDYDLLRAELEDLGGLDGFDLESTGFSSEELDKLLRADDVPTLDELEDEYGEHDEMDGWPVIKVRVEPQVKEMWDSTMQRAAPEGIGDSIRLDRILHCVDMGALAAYAETE